LRTGEKRAKNATTNPEQEGQEGRNPRSINNSKKSISEKKNEKKTIPEGRSPRAKTKRGEKKDGRKGGIPDP